MEDALRHDWPHHWPEVEAEVTDCTFVRFKSYLDVYGVEDQLAHYAVGFRYEVNGIAHTGVLSSPVKVEPQDRFFVRYDPEHPEQNNSLASELDSHWFNDYMYVVAAAIFGLMFVDFVHRQFFLGALQPSNGARIRRTEPRPPDGVGERR